MSVIDTLQNKITRMNLQVRVHLFDDVIVVCFVAVNLRFNISILYWAQNTFLAREINKKKAFSNYI